MYKIVGVVLIIILLLNLMHLKFYPVEFGIVHNVTNDTTTVHLPRIDTTCILHDPPKLQLKEELIVFTDSFLKKFCYTRPPLYYSKVLNGFLIIFLGITMIASGFLIMPL